MWKLRPTCFALAALAISASGAVSPSARACAVLPANNSPSVPDLSQERVLLLFDRGTQTEHFVREVRFQHVTTRFAFLVPTPAKPEVEKVEKAPWDALEAKYPFWPPEPPRFMLSAAKSAPPDRGVEVHEVKRIGSFTAFVLSATDASALDKWFSENDISRPPNAIQWLEHFVQKKFFVTAFRYEPQDSADGAMDAETVRLTFRTRDAYYPYIEPMRTGSPVRQLHVWTIAKESLVPAALFAPKDGPIRWGTAWREGAAYDAGRGELKEQLPGVAAFLPGDGTLRIQTFQDDRPSRNGVSDVVLANEGDRPTDPDFLTRATALLGSLDKLLHTGDAEPTVGATPITDAFEVHPTSRGCFCAAAGGEGGSSTGALAFLAAAGLLSARRRKPPHRSATRD